MSEAEIDEPDEMTLAISTAKIFLSKAFKGESIENIEFEEIQPPDFGNIWKVTLGFNRRKDSSTVNLSSNLLSNSFLQAVAAATVRPRRVYKIVSVDVAGPKAISITNRKED